MKKLSGQTVCDGLGVSHTDWSAGGAHPKSYRPWEVRSGLIAKARSTPEECNAAAAIQDAQRMFVRARELAAPGAGSAAAVCEGGALAQPAATYDHALPGNCTLVSAGLQGAPPLAAALGG